MTQSCGIFVKSFVNFVILPQNATRLQLYEIPNFVNFILWQEFALYNNFFYHENSWFQDRKLQLYYIFMTLSQSHIVCLV